MTLPDYQCLAYRKQAPIWTYLEDVYRGLPAWVDFQPDGTVKATAKSRSYLPQESSETDGDYGQRLSRSAYATKFASAIRDFIGIIFNNGLRFTDVPRPIEQVWGSLGRGGVSGELFLARAAMASLRCGHSFLMVDSPQHDPGVRSHRDMVGSGRHPFWSAIAPLRLIDWEYETHGNQEILTRAVLADTRAARTANGEQLEERYLELLPGEWRLHRAGKDQQGRKTFDLVDAGAMGRVVRGRVVPFDFVPLVPLYGGDKTGFFESNPTLFTLAQLNVAHYQVNSDHRMKMHLCCFPQPVRVGGDGSPIKLGYRLAIDVPIGGAFTLAEPQSQSLAMSRAEVADLDRQMDFIGADYLAKPGDRQAAMTTIVSANKLESALYLLAKDLSEGITSALGIHAAYLGLDYGGRVELNTKFFEDAGHDPQLLLAYLRMKELDVLSAQQTLALAKDKRFIPSDFNLGDSIND